MGKLEIRAERKANGLCIYCGKNPPKNGRMGCESCLRKKHDDYLASRKFYLSIGICPVCHKQKIAEGHKVCADCLEKAADYKRMQYRRKELARGT